jgi:hypothetical protein
MKITIHSRCQHQGDEYQLNHAAYQYRHCSRQHSGTAEFKERMVSQGMRNPRQFIAVNDILSECDSITGQRRSPAFLKHAIRGKLIPKNSA